MDELDHLGRYECSGCKNVFFVTVWGEDVTLNEPKFCPFCGARIVGINYEDYGEEA